MCYKPKCVKGYPDHSTVIGHLANFRKDGVKNQLMLVRAAALVANEAQFRMFLCGYPSEYQQKVEQEIVALGLEGVVMIPGRLFATGGTAPLAVCQFIKMK